MRFLIDECLHVGLVAVANHLGYDAHHVTHLGMGGLKDHEIIPRIRDEEFTFVTNNAVDFRRLYRREDLHAGLIIIVPNVRPEMQRQLFQATLEYLNMRELINAVLEIDSDGEEVEIHEYGSITTPRALAGTAPWLFTLMGSFALRMHSFEPRSDVAYKFFAIIVTAAGDQALSPPGTRKTCRTALLRRVRLCFSPISSRFSFVSLHNAVYRPPARC